MFQSYIPGAVKTRKRTSPGQLSVLEDVFTNDQKPDTALRKQLAERLEMTSREVQVWFQNRRAKAKKAAEKNRTASLTGAALPRDNDDPDPDDSGSDARPPDPSSSPPTATRPLASPALIVPTAQPPAWSAPTPHTALPTRTSFSVSPSASAAAVPPPPPSSLNSLRRASLPANVLPFTSQHQTHHAPIPANRHYPVTMPPHEDVHHRRSVGTLTVHPWAGVTHFGHDVGPPGLDARSYSDATDLRRSNRYEPYHHHRPNLGHRASVPAILHANAAHRLNLTEYGAHEGANAEPVDGWTNPWASESFPSQNGNPAAQIGMGLLPESGYTFGHASSPNSPGTPALGDYTFPPRLGHIPKTEDVDPLSVGPFGPGSQLSLSTDNPDSGVIGVEVEHPSPRADGLDGYGRQGSLQWSESSASTSNSGRGSLGGVNVPYPDPHAHEYDASAERRGSCMSASEMFSELQVSDPHAAGRREEYHGAAPYHSQSNFAASSSSLSVPPAPYDNLDQYGRRGSDQLSPEAISRRGSADSNFSHAQPGPYSHPDSASVTAASYGSPDPNMPQGAKSYPMVPSFESSELALALRERTDESPPMMQSYGSGAPAPSAQAYSEYAPHAYAAPTFNTGNNLFGTSYPPQPQPPHAYGPTDTSAGGMQYS